MDYTAEAVVEGEVELELGASVGVAQDHPAQSHWAVALVNTG